MVGGAGERAGSRQLLRSGLESLERVDLPREVVEPDRLLSRQRRACGRPDLEQPEIMIVRRVRSAKKCSTRKAVWRHLVDAPKPQHALVKSDGLRQIADVEDSMVEAEDSHIRET